MHGGADRHRGDPEAPGGGVGSHLRDRVEGGLDDRSGILLGPPGLGLVQRVRATCDHVLGAIGGVQADLHGGGTHVDADDPPGADHQPIAASTVTVDPAGAGGITVPVTSRPSTVKVVTRPVGPAGLWTQIR